MTDIDLKHVPTDQLLTELRRRCEEFMNFCANLLKHPVAAPPPAPEPAPEPKVEPVHIPPAAPACEQPRPNPADLLFKKAEAAGLRVPRSRTSAELPPDHFEKAAIPNSFACSPELRASQLDAEIRELGALNLSDMAAEARAEGSTDAADYLEGLPRALALRKQARMPTAELLRLNRRYAESAEVVKIQKARPELAVNPDPTTGIAWFDDPAVLSVYVTVEALEADVNLADFTDALVKACEAACNPMFVGHLPSPIAHCEHGELTVLGEPCAMWHFLLALDNMDPKFTKAADLMAFKLAKQVIDYTPSLKADYDRDSVTVKDFATASRLHSLVSRILQDALASENPRKKALKRQIRIMNPIFREFSIPNERQADALGVSDPRVFLPAEFKEEGPDAED